MRPTTREFPLVAIVAVACRRKLLVDKTGQAPELLAFLLGNHVYLDGIDVHLRAPHAARMLVAQYPALTGAVKRFKGTRYLETQQAAWEDVFTLFGQRISLPVTRD